MQMDLTGVDIMRTGRTGCILKLPKYCNKEVIDNLLITQKILV
jgi:hypothetical protein